MGKILLEFNEKINHLFTLSSPPSLAMSPHRMYHQTLGLGTGKVTDRESRGEENVERAGVLVAAGEEEPGLGATRLLTGCFTWGRSPAIFEIFLSPVKRDLDRSLTFR